MNYKILCIVHKCLVSSGPAYLTNLLCYVPVHRHGLRSGDYTARKLLIPRVRCETCAFRSFGVHGLFLWNILQVPICNINDVA